MGRETVNHNKSVDYDDPAPIGRASFPRLRPSFRRIIPHKEMYRQKGPLGGMRKIPKDILRLPLEQRALIAFQEAVAGVHEEHARLGLPLYISRGGKVVAISAEEARRGYKAACKKELRKLCRA